MPRVRNLYELYGIGGFSDEGEILIRGNFAQQEPAESSKPELPFVDMDRDPSPEILWLKKVYPLLNSLDSRGISWEWLNNELIEQAQIEDSAININGYRHTQILVPHAAHMTVETATRLNTFAQAGIHVTFIGDLPSKQPSFFDYQKQDEKLIEVNHKTLQSPSAWLVRSADDAKVWMDTLPRTLQFKNLQSSLFHIQREQSNGRSFKS